MLREQDIINDLVFLVFLWAFFSASGKEEGDVLLWICLEAEEEEEMGDQWIVDRVGGKGGAVKGEKLGRL